MTYKIKTSKIGKAPIKVSVSNSPLKGVGDDLSGKRVDDTTRYNPDGTVDSTPVGHKKAKASGLSWSAVSKNKKDTEKPKGGYSAVKGEADRQATAKETQKIREQASQAKPGSGGMTPEMIDV